MGSIKTTINQTSFSVSKRHKTARMAGLSCILLPITVLLVSATDASAQVFIKPEPGTECPSSPCPTINELLEQHEHYFTSHTTLHFLTGLHVVAAEQSSVAVLDVEQLTLVGTEGSVVQCDGPFGLAFFNVTALNISTLSFDGCGSEWPDTESTVLYYDNIYYRDSYSANIVINESQKVSLSSISVQGPLSGIHCINVFSASVTNMSFIASKITFTYINTVIPSSASVAHASVSNLSFFNPDDGEPAYGFYTLILARKFAVILELNNVTFNDSQALVDFEVSGCNHFTLYVSNLFVLKNITVILNGLQVQCTRSSDIAVLLKKIRIETGTLYFSLINLLNVTITEMEVYLMPHLFAIKNSIVTFNSLFYMANNLMALYSTFNIINSRISFHGNTMIARYHGYESYMYMENSTALFTGNATFTDNISNRGPGVIETTDGSIVSLQGNINFIGNQGESGGAIALYDNSYILLHPSTNITFKSNSAKSYGGVIYVVTEQKQHSKFSLVNIDPIVSPFRDLQSECFYTLHTLENFHELQQQSDTKAQLIFDNNTAGWAGTDIYGGSIDTCTLPTYWPAVFGIKTFKDDLFRLESNNTVTSDPTRVCICENMHPNCTNSVLEIQHFPGQEFPISVAAVGQLQIATPGTVYAEIRDDGNHYNSEFPKLIRDFQRTNLLSGSCTELSYTPLSENQRATLVLTIKPNLPAFSDKEIKETVIKVNIGSRLSLGKRMSKYLVLPVHIGITFKPCPLGFVLSEGSCNCTEVLQKHNLSCDITTQTVHKDPNMWIGTVQVSNATEVIVVHNYCPYDYCNRDQTEVSLDSQDEQCALNHAGTLCGKCRANYSSVLGTSRCKRCNNTMLVLLPVFVTCGALLVIALIQLNLTVSVGTINGLIFYANIIQANRASFFPNTQSFLSIFIAWLNLDFGIETCFYNGLDEYTKTWLQFVFPLYIWLLVVLLIVWSHYTSTGTKLVGNNAVFVLATLFLLSYAKIVRNIVGALSFTILQLPNSTRAVWLYDANIEYFSAKHAPLFVVAVGVLLLISIPYTALLLFAQCLLTSNRLCIKRAMPLLDAYTGPYKNKHRYWIGLLLLVRVFLFLVFSANVFGDPQTNMFAIILTTSGVLLYKIYINGAYTSKLLTMFEAQFHFNLLAVSASRLYPFQERNHLIATNVLVGIAFATFCCMVVYHSYLAVRSHRRGGLLIQTATEWCRAKRDRMAQTLAPTTRDGGGRGEGEGQPGEDQVTAQNIPTTTIQLREPLLASQESTY